MSYAHQSYKTANITTADRGKLVIMIYDHCIKWTKKAEEELGANRTEPMVRVMVEAADQVTADRLAHALAVVVRECLAL